MEGTLVSRPTVFPPLIISCFLARYVLCGPAFRPWTRDWPPTDLSIWFFDLWNNTALVKWMPRATRPAANMVIVPSIGEAYATQWDLLHDRISSAMPNEPLFFGMKSTNDDYAKIVDSLWEAWQHLANIEIRANFAVPLDHKFGGGFSI